MKLSISTFIFNALHFLIKLALKNRKRKKKLKDFWDMSAFILHIMLIYSLNINEVFQSFKKLHVHSIM